MPPKIISKEVQQQQQQQIVVTEQVPTQQIETPVELEGLGRFEYQDGTVYEGQWKQIGNNKFKHGNGTVIIASTLSQEAGLKEEYNGQWVNDKMEGQGIYRYKSGATYTGQWKNNMHHGYGKYQFQDYCIYEGQWYEHKMHGEGIFQDKEGTQWSGEFVNGIYQSKMQKQLKIEKMLKKKESEIMLNSTTFFNRFQEQFYKSDKKTFKENLSQFFAQQDEIKIYYKDTVPKYEDRLPDKWADSIKLISEFTTINVLRTNSQAKIIEINNILATQFSGIGQIVEIQKEIESRIIKLVLCNTSENQWTIVYYHDSQEVEVQPKKK